MNCRISIKECRKILGDIGNSLSDEQVVELRSLLYSISENIINKHLER